MADTVLGTISEIFSGKSLTIPSREQLAGPRTLNKQADMVRVPCLSVRTEGLPFGFGEYVAKAADWWGRLVGGAVEILGPHPIDPHDEVRFGVEGGAVVELPPKREPRPRIDRKFGSPPGGFQVMLPGWEDAIVIDNEKIFDQRSARQRAVDVADQLSKSPTPPGVRELGTILTEVDNVQDIAATLGVGLMLAEKVAGRIIPGLGAVTTAADGLNALYSVLSLDPKGAVAGFQRVPRGPVSERLLHWRGSPAGREHKRRLAAAAGARVGGMRARLDDLRLTGRLRVGVGDVLQGLQATETLFGTGLQLGAFVGYAQDAFFGVVRGATFELPSSLVDPIGLGLSERDACYRSPPLSLIDSRAYYVFANNALSLWSSAARLGPWLSSLPESVLSSVLVGLRFSEIILRPWLQSGVWVDPVAAMIQERPIPRGTSEVFQLSELLGAQYLDKASVLSAKSIVDAIQNVPDATRQQFYSSLATSFAWGSLGSLEPNGVVSELNLNGPLADVVALAEAGLVPDLDLV